jgi:hypothetical protein
MSTLLGLSLEGDSSRGLLNWARHRRRFHQNPTDLDPGRWGAWQKMRLQKLNLAKITCIGETGLRCTLKESPASLFLLPQGKLSHNSGLMVPPFCRNQGGAAVTPGRTVPWHINCQRAGRKNAGQPSPHPPSIHSPPTVKSWAHH